MDRNDSGGGVLWLDSDARRQEYREGRGVVPAGQVILRRDPRQGDVNHSAGVFLLVPAQSQCWSVSIGSCPITVLECFYWFPPKCTTAK